MQRALLSILLSGLGEDAVKVAGGLTVAILIALAFAISSLMAIFGAAAPGHAIASARIEEIPAEQLALMETAAASCGLPWQVLAAVAKVDSDFGRNMAATSAGTGGYAQLPAATMPAFGNSGRRDDYGSALPALARYLCDHGGAGDVRGALAAYNQRADYTDEVLAVAVRYGYLAPGAFSTQVLDLARAQTGRPYVWGGSSPQTSFDCSGLVQWVYGQLGVTVPRTAQQQFNATAPVTQDQLQPGDLVFFARTYPSAELITHVGIYVGNGRMINAPTEGDVIREMSVFTGFWGAHYAGAGRVRS